MASESSHQYRNSVVYHRRTFIITFLTLFPPCSDPEYQLYLSSVSPLVPWAPPLYRLTPYPLKLLFCCEFPFYKASPEPSSNKPETESPVVDKQPPIIAPDENTHMTANP